MLDPRTLVPLDVDAIAASVAKTNRVVVAHEAVRFGGFGAEIAAHVAEHCFWDLDAPVVRVGAPSHPVPYQKDLELLTLPGAAEIAAAFARCERAVRPGRQWATSITIRSGDVVCQRRNPARRCRPRPKDT